MHSIQRINQALAQLVASLNVVAAVLIVLMTAAAGYTWAGLVGIIVGVVVGTVFAGVVCGSARAPDQHPRSAGRLAHAPPVTRSGPSWVG